MMIPIEPFKYHNINEFKKDQDKALKNIFRGEINGSFLIKILYNVIDKLGNELINYYPRTLTVENSLSGNQNIAEYDICRMIVGLNKSNMIFIDKDKQKNILNSNEYQNQLIDSVVENVKLREYGSGFFRNNQITYGDRFLYFHLPYDLFVICTRMNELLLNNTIQGIPTYSIIGKISEMGLSALTLMENNFLENIYPICRGIIELYLSLICLSTNKKVISKYNFLMQTEAMFSRCGLKYPENFYDAFNNRINQEDKEIYSYLHYGWVDEIRDFHKIVKRKPYSTKGLFTYLKKEYQDIDFDTMEDFYQRCHSYAHANIISCIYPLNSYFEILIMMYLTIVPSYKILCSHLKCPTEVNNIDILNKLTKDFELFKNQYEKRTTENFEKYYNRDKL